MVTEAFESMDCAAGNGSAIPLLEVAVAQVMTRLAALDDVIEHDGYGMGYGHSRPAGPDAPGQALVLGLQTGPGSGSGLGGFLQDGLQPIVAFPGGATS